MMTGIHPDQIPAYQSTIPHANIKISPNESPRGWTIPSGRPQASLSSGGGLSEGYGHDGPGVCLGDGQTEAYLKDMGMTGLASAWAMARR